MAEHDTGEFNVVQFFASGNYEYVRRGVDARTAVEAAHHYCNSVGAQIGTTTRVIITDGGDCTNFEWIYGKGVVFGRGDDDDMFDGDEPEREEVDHQAQRWDYQRDLRKHSW